MRVNMKKKKKLWTFQSIIVGTNEKSKTEIFVENIIYMFVRVRVKDQRSTTLTTGIYI